MDPETKSEPSLQLQTFPLQVESISGGSWNCGRRQNNNMAEEMGGLFERCDVVVKNGQHFRCEHPASKRERQCDAILFVAQQMTPLLFPV